MNENITRRGFIDVINGAIASFFFPKMFRKPRSIEASIPESTRILDISKDGDGTGVVKMVSLEDVRLGAADIIDPPDEPVLAHPITRKNDEAILFDENGFWKDDIIEAAGDYIWEDNEYKGFSQGGLTDEEFAAYQRWLNSEYPVVTITSEATPIGLCTDAGEAEKSDTSGAGAEVERLPVPRDADQAIAA